tara:strand:+ start:3023 stop:9259 length:6237 start_codon:yes stop_codon:yes gene_type:complete
MELKISSSVSQITPSSLFNDGFELSDQTIIPSENIAGAFSPEENRVELFIYDTNISLLESSYQYNDWTITQNSNTSGLNDTDILQIDPSNDLIKRGYDIGDLYAVYNFINYELSTSPTNLLYISEISSDRTEIKLNSNFISNEDLESSFNILKSKVDSAEYFDEFYISSLGNNYNIGVNLLLDTSTEQYSILIKLYDALPDSFFIKDEIYVTTKIAETQAYSVKFFTPPNLELDNVQYLKGPNYNLEIKDFVNNSTELKSKSELLDAVTTGSNNNLQNILNQKGVKITPNYSFSTFNEFVNFSSAKKRIENFYEKVSQIQSYEDDIATIKSSITGSTSGSSQVISTLSSANNNIENIIKNLDGYEYHLFYTSGSSAYPKVSGSDFPHTLQNTGSTEVLQWLGSDIEGSSTYGGIILSASLYDNTNQNWLYYTIPEFIRDNQDNNNYIDFSNMAGQHFDEIWLYTKAVTEKNNTTNELDKGIPLKLSQDAIKSLGYEGFGSNLNNQNNYMGLIGEEDGSYVPPTGNEIIDNYIAINNGTVVNYWSPSYSFLYYVEQLGEKGFPYPIDKVSKEIYKRLYHNMAYLVKKKGTVSGLRQLINIWGIPDTILRINEFGGKNKKNINDYDYWYNRYSYAFSPIANQNVASASAIIPWMPLERNRITDVSYININLRYPTKTEWDDESSSWGSLNRDGAFASVLKLPSAGNRSANSGFLGGEGSQGRYWSSDVLIGSNARYIFFNNLTSLSTSQSRAQGQSVRLIVDGTFTQAGYDNNYSGKTTEYLGLTYGFVYNTTTQKIWLDRNLGATQVATSYNDTSSYGDLYQWGRSADGHQIRTSSVYDGLISKPANKSASGDWNSKFIKTSVTPFDWLSVQDDSLGEEIISVSIIGNGKYIVPDNLQFRFKTSGYPTSSYAGEFFSQSLAVKKSDGDETSTNFDFGVGLFYTGSAVGTYSGSNNTTYRDWGVVRFYISGSPSEGGTVVSDDIYLPLYDNGWWSLMLQRDTHPSASVHTTNTTYTLYVKNKTYNGKDRNQISFQGSASISIDGSTSSSINEAWNKFGTGSHDGVYLGGLVSGSNVGPHTLNSSGKMFSGSFQEFRYYSNDIPETVFNDFVMNPESIEGNNITGSESSFDIVNFRAPLGNELEDKFETSISSSHTESFTSFHPAVSAKSNLLVTGSFVNPDGNVTSSNYHIRYYENETTRTFSQPNTETYFLDQPQIGSRNRISNKIEVVNNDNFGNVLSNTISIEQDYEISRSYTEDITSLEVAFSPQDNVNDDIIQAFGYGLISDALADPRFISSSSDYYPQLKKSAEYFFQKYTEGNIYDYIRLIKYVDNSLFKAIKAYVPARTSVSTGIIIKQHMLERNRFTPPSITNKTTVAVYPNDYNTPLVFKNLELTSSIPAKDDIKPLGSQAFGSVPVTQSYNNTFDTVLGLQTIIEDTEKEFYDGAYSGSIITATTQSLFYNPFKIFSDPSETIILVNTTASSLTPLQIPLSSFPFDNSIYNATINNVILNRPNTFLQDVDYSTDASTPINLDLIKTNSAIKANTPDSNYTMRRVTRPRYEGSRLQSADYNFPTNPSSSITFLNGDTGSYNGDESFGPTAVVDKNPIFFAHFKSSNESKELFDSYLFKVDALIGLPFEDITGDEESTSIPKIIKLDGSNDNLYETSNVFEPGREALISYDTLTANGVDLSILPIGLNKIYQGGLEYNLINGTEKSKTEYLSTQNYITASYCLNVKGRDGNLDGDFPLNPTPTTFSPSKTHKDLSYWMIKDPNYSGVFGYENAHKFYLAGGNMSLTQSLQIKNSFPANTEIHINGASLALINTLNTTLLTPFPRLPYFPYDRTTIPGGITNFGFSSSPPVYNSEYYSSTVGSIGFTPYIGYDLGTETYDEKPFKEIQNYFKFNVSQSFEGSYEDPNEIFTIKAGDELRITYNKQPDTPSPEVYNCTILKVGQSSNPPIHVRTTFDDSPGQPINYGDFPAGFSGGSPSNPAITWDFTPDSVFDMLIVTPPPPLELQFVYNFTIRRRVQADNKVLIFQSPPINSDGANTPTGEGYIVPNDCTPTQKKNALTLISQLKGTNTFD